MAFNSSGDLLAKLSRTTALSKPIQNHLTSVYSFLSVLFLSATAGCYVHLSGIFSGGILSVLVGSGLGIALAFTPPSLKNERTRKWLATGAAFCQGLSIGPLLSQFALSGHLDLVFQALSASAVVFASFSAASVMASQRAVIYVLAFVGSLASTAWWLGLWNVFLGSRSTYSIELYLGMVLMAGYIIAVSAVDTQMILARAELGARDVPGDAFTLFVDAVQLFVRVLIVLAKNKEDKEERDRKTRDKRRR
ncbi:Bax inhibitor 1 [Gonapodya sp. JEL0774]|nr:Bax inhibitor 1 [Gonapodya sp. JEL0774]